MSVKWYLIGSLELRNNIYQYAYEDTYSSFPTISFRTEQDSRRRRPSNSKKDLRIIPYLGLVQSCVQIRAEFRAWWLSALKIPLCALNRYLSVFLPRPLKKNKTLFEAYGNASGTLRIFLRRDELECRDILRLIKYKVQCPNYTIAFKSMFGVSSDQVQGLDQLVNNRHPVWLRWVRANVISQVRIQLNETTYEPRTVTLVLKERFAPAWMKQAFRQIPEEYPASIGLDEIKGWKLLFRVAYWWSASYRVRSSYLRTFLSVHNFVPLHQPLFESMVSWSCRTRLVLGFQKWTSSDRKSATSRVDWQWFTCSCYIEIMCVFCFCAYEVVRDASFESFLWRSFTMETCLILEIGLFRDTPMYLASSGPRDIRGFLVLLCIVKRKNLSDQAFTYRNWLWDLALLYFSSKVVDSYGLDDAV